MWKKDLRGIAIARHWLRCEQFRGLASQAIGQDEVGLALRLANRRLDERALQGITDPIDIAIG